MKLIVLAIFAVSGQATAQQVYKCVKGKDVSYQSAPCAADQKASKQWEAVPEPPPTSAQLWQKHYARQRAERESAYLRGLAGRSGSPGRASGSGASVSSSSSGNTCADAKRRRDEIERQVGLNRTVEGMQALSSMVYEACKK